MPIMKDARCSVCKNGMRTIKIVEKKVRVEHVPCTSDGCVKGYHATRCHLCRGKGCSKCSTVEKHGIVGRALCKNCMSTKPDGSLTSEGCLRCRSTGLILVQCRDCKGRGWVKHETLLEPEKQIGAPEQVPCLYCQGGRSVPTGSVGAALSEALAEKDRKRNRAEVQASAPQDHDTEEPVQEQAAHKE